MKIARHVSLLCGLFLIPIAAFGSTRTWTGAGGNLVWSNGANWVGGTAPRSGDDLVFAGQSTTNDLAALSLSSITVTSGSSTFSGNAVSVGALHVADSAHVLTTWPFIVTSSDTLVGGSLKLEASRIGNATIDSGTLEVAADNGASDATSLSLGPSAQFVADIAAGNWVMSTDYLVVHGNISLGGSKLVVSPGFITPGQTHTIIRNDGPNPVSGTFQGLPEGAWFIQTRMYRITYHGGSSGRDVALLIPFNAGTWLFSSQATSNFGSPLTLTAHVIAWGAAPTGLVEFFDGATSLGTGVINDWQDAKITTYALSPGSHALTAVYQGTDLFSPNLFSPSTSAPLAQQIRQAQAITSTTLSGGSLPIVAGQKVTFTALVQAPGLTPAGTMTFFDGGLSLGTVPVDGTGKATVETTLSSGTHSVYASFNGSLSFTQSTSNTLTEAVVAMVLTQTALNVSSNPAVVGVPVVLTAIVQAANGFPQGAVNFMDGSSVLGVATIGFDRSASLSVDTLTPGVHTLTALYLGGGGFSASNSAPVEQQIEPSSSVCAPVIVAPPADTMLSADGTATLTVGVEGGQPQVFQWFAGSYPDMSRPFGFAATARITNTWAPTDVWVLVTNGCGTAHASVHLTAFVPSRRRAAGH
jgi:Bacterial Ig-like domain (group 3)